MKHVAVNAGGAPHPRNQHGAVYDYERLTRATPALSSHLRPHPGGGFTINFSDALALKELNRALLRAHYGIEQWDIPAGHLCPAVPGRAEYIHHLADLLAGDALRPLRDPEFSIIDVGVGASCIYPLIGVAEYGWRFVATDIEPTALESARRIVMATPALVDRVEFRLQASSEKIFADVTRAAEHFDASICNPPFHRSALDAGVSAAQRKGYHGDSGAEAGPDLGGTDAELWCEGGEVSFLARMIAESAERPTLCRWFTSLVSRRASLPHVMRFLEALPVQGVRTIEMTRGQKRSRIVAWSFTSTTSCVGPGGVTSVAT